MIECVDNNISAITNTGDVVTVGQKHPLLMSELDGIMVPEINIRADLYARFSRNAFYDLSEMAREEKDGRFFVNSDGGQYFLS
jgi:hypothetical protein